jgi:hypothetical protein
VLSFNSKSDVSAPRKIVARFGDSEKMGVAVSEKLYYHLRNRGKILD